MNINDKAWAILKLFAPDISPESFKELTFDKNKTDAENKAIMLKEIADGKLGFILAVGARWLLKHNPSSEESEKMVNSTEIEQVKKEIGTAVEEANKKENSEISEIADEKQEDIQKSQILQQ